MAEVNWKGVLSTLAPTVASALLGPLGGMAVSAIGSIMGIDEPTQDKIKTAITSGQMTGEQVVALKQLELEFKDHELERQFKYADLEFKDSQSARDMQTATKSTTPTILTYLITVGFFGILGYMMTEHYHSSEPLLVMLGSLGTAWTACVSFWFGSSHGSQGKDALLAQAQPIK